MIWIFVIGMFALLALAHWRIDELETLVKNLQSVPGPPGPPGPAGYNGDPCSGPCCQNGGK